jgi:acyl-CoA thioesterase-1
MASMEIGLPDFVTKLSRIRSYGESIARVHSLAAMAAAVFLLLVLPGIALAQAAPERPVKIVAFGDSLTAGYDLPAKDGFPAQLERALKARGVAVEVANAGVSGDTSAGGLARLDWAVPEGIDAVIVEFGANDMLRGINPATTRKSIETIVQTLRARGIEVLLCGMRAAPNMGNDYVREFDAIFTELAARYDLVFYPFFLDGIATQAKFALRDGVHPNAAGVEQIVIGIVPKVEELIVRVRKKRGA